jgi:hypothetical protein
MSRKFFISRDFNSDPQAGAQNISDLGSSFDVFLNPPLHIPHKAKNIYLIVDSATIWYNTPNINEGANNNFRIIYDSTTYDIVLPTGLYTVDSLSNKIRFALSNQGLPEDLIVLFGDISEDKAVIEFNYPDTQIDFTINNSIRDILGFDSRFVPLAPTVNVPLFETGDTVAKFNNIEFYYIKSSLLSRGLATNSDYSGILAKILIDVDVGSQIKHKPFKNFYISASELTGANLTRINFQLTDDKNQLINTREQPFSITFQIQYEVD